MDCRQVPSEQSMSLIFDDDGINFLPKSARSEQDWMMDQRAPFHATFYHNGDRFNPGFDYVVVPKRMRDITTLMDELSHSVFCDQKFLSNGVRYIFTVDGERIFRICDLQENGNYVCSSSPFFAQCDYLSIISSPKWKRSGYKACVPDLFPYSKNPCNSRSAVLTQSSRYEEERSCASNYGSRIVHIIANCSGRPRRIEQFLLNGKTAPFFEKFMNSVSLKLALASGPVKRIYNLEGVEVTSLLEFYDDNGIFFACGKDPLLKSDLKLTIGEIKKIDENRRYRMNKYKMKGDSMKTARVTFEQRPSDKLIFSSGDMKKVIASLAQLKEKYAVGKTLSTLNCASIRECWLRENKSMLVMKEIDLDRCSDYNTIIREVAILLELKHPNLPSVLDIFGNKHKIILITEFYKDGNILYQLLELRKYSELDVSGIISHLASALAYLHSKHIVHRDVKLDNLLVSVDTSGIKTLKLCDFGLAIYANNENLTQICGTPLYMAPEIFEESGYGAKVDVWAAGIITALLLTGKYAHGCSLTDHNIIFNQLMKLNCIETTGPHWEHVSPSAKEFVKKCLAISPTNRISSHDMISYQWIKDDNLPCKDNLYPITSSNLHALTNKKNAAPFLQGLSVIATTSVNKEKNYFLSQPD